MSNDVKLVDIAQLNTLQEAYMLKAKLESEGVTAFIPDEYMGTALPIFGNSTQGYRVQVYLNEAHRAMDILYEEE